MKWRDLRRERREQEGHRALRPGARPRNQSSDYSGVKALLVLRDTQSPAHKSRAQGCTATHSAAATSSRNGRLSTAVRACGCAVNRGDWSPLRVSSFCIVEQMRPGRYIGDVVRRSSALERHRTRIHRARRARQSAEAAGGASAERECAIAGQMSLTAPQGVRGWLLEERWRPLPPPRP